jgi:hypothetical protein
MLATMSTSSGEFGKSSSNPSGVEPSRQAKHHKVEMRGHLANPTPDTSLRKVFGNTEKPSAT